MKLATSTLACLSLIFSPAAFAGPGAGPLPIKADRIESPERILFQSGKPLIAAESFRLLDSVAATLEVHPELAQIEIGVHSDSRGSSGFNQRLTQQRADTVRTYLIAKGVHRNLLKAVGYGETRPIASNRTAEGRQQNSRVEFTILTRCPAKQKFRDGKCRP